MKCPKCGLMMVDDDATQDLWCNSCCMTRSEMQQTEIESLRAQLSYANERWAIEFEKRGHETASLERQVATLTERAERAERAIENTLLKLNDGCPYEPFRGPAKNRTFQGGFNLAMHDIRVFLSDLSKSHDCPADEGDSESKQD